MKSSSFLKLIIPIILGIILLACNSCNGPLSTTVTPRNEIYLKDSFIYDGHSYLIMRASEERYSTTLLHNPNCKNMQHISLDTGFYYCNEGGEVIAYPKNLL